MRNIISVEDEELPAITCPWTSEAALQSILIGRDAETRGMSALGLFKGGQVPSIVSFHGDTGLSSIRWIKLSVAASVPPLPIISSRPVCSAESVNHPPTPTPTPLGCFLCGSSAAWREAQVDSDTSPLGGWTLFAVIKTEKSFHLASCGT